MICTDELLSIKQSIYYTILCTVLYFWLRSCNVKWLLADGRTELLTKWFLETAALFKNNIWPTVLLLGGKSDYVARGWSDTGNLISLRSRFTSISVNHFLNTDFSSRVLNLFWPKQNHEPFWTFLKGPRFLILIKSDKCYAESSTKVSI